MECIVVKKIAKNKVFHDLNKWTEEPQEESDVKIKMTGKNLYE